MSGTALEANDVPIPDAHVSTVASEHAISEPALADTLAEIHGDLVEGADAIHQYYRSEDTPQSTVAADGLAEVIFVPTRMWEEIPTELTDEQRAAAKVVHTEFARDLGVDEPILTTHDALVMPSAEVGKLVRAGLSRRQAEVQVLRKSGLTQAAIGERLGMATNTVKVHCHRIDTKVSSAARLLSLVDT